MENGMGLLKKINSMNLKERREMFPNLTDEDFDSMQYCSEEELTMILLQCMETGKRRLWFDRDICGLDAEGMALLQQLEEQSRKIGGSGQVDSRQLRYLKQLREMKLHVPLLFRTVNNPRVLYRRLTAFSRAHDIPEEIVPRIVPVLIAYVETGHMRPVILVGEKGCGKTTAIQLLIKEALHIPVKVIKVPQTAGGHGMTGDCASYHSADVGDLAKARLSENSLVLAYIFDEIDKAPHRNNGANIEDELLSITDESCSDIYEQFLETTLVGLDLCPKFMTANEIEEVSPVLVDRCLVIHFPNADADRIKSISRKYVDKKLQTALYRMISFDYELMDKHIEYLVHKKVTSLRKHQQMIEEVLGKALDQAMSQETDDAVQVTEAMFKDAERVVLGTMERHAGF